MTELVVTANIQKLLNGQRINMYDFKSKFESVSLWDSLKNHWISVNIEALNFFSVRYIDWNSVNFHGISEILTDSNLECERRDDVTIPIFLLESTRTRVSFTQQAVQPGYMEYGALRRCCFCSRDVTCLPFMLHGSGAVRRGAAPRWFFIHAQRAPARRRRSCRCNNDSCGASAYDVTQAPLPI